eukprot:snap_masked-scaffold_3-processed-gene-19.51-mRNA-1 protein AED:1.00 eAED:1.00 QI:0/0/0/0/1/1/3/0/273
MLQLVNKFVARRFKASKRSSHYIAKENIKKNKAEIQYSEFRRKMDFKDLCFCRRNVGNDALELLKSPLITLRSWKHGKSLKFNLERNTYIFQVIDLEHVGHDFRSISTVKKYLNDLTEAELEILHTLGRAETSIAAAQLALHRTFPEIVYDKTLTKCEMMKARSNRKDSGDSDMEVLVQCGQRCQARGGKFELYFNRSAHGKAQLRGLTFQEPEQKQLASIYSYCIQIDTTHDITRYKMLVMMPVGDDYFFRSIFFGCSFIETENSFDVVKSL